MAEVSASAWPRLMRYALLLILPGSVLAYIALTMTINSQPPYGTFNGWVAVMQHYNQPSGDQVDLQVQAYTFGNQPLVTYTVGICGRQPFSGDLLIGRDAELFRPNAAPSIATEPLIPPAAMYAVTRLGLSLFSQTTLPFPPTSNIGPVEVVQIQASAPVPCGFQAEVSDVQAWVEGYLAVPIQQNWKGPLGLWHGPNFSQAWPATGELPYAGHNVYWKFNGPDIVPALTGYWGLPPNEQVQVSNPPSTPPASWSVDAQPAATSLSALQWTSDSAIQPTARLTDSGSINTLQDWLVVVGVGMGVGGSLLAGMVYEALRSRGVADAADAQHIRGPPPNGPVPPPGPGTRPDEV